VPRRDHVAEPDRLEVGREEEPGRPQHVVAIGELEILAGVIAEQRSSAVHELLLTGKNSGGRQMRDALGEPEVLVTRGVTVIPLA
jgi:hypothetical protein